MPENYRNSSEDLAQGAKTGARVAKQAASTVKNTVSAAGKAATGNLAGAALDLARDKTWRTIALFLVVTVLFSVFCAVFLFPMALFEAAAKLAEEWKIEYYSGTGGRLVSFLKATGSVIWNAIKGESSEEGDTDLATDSDLGIIDSEADLNSVYSRKLQAAKDKITARQKQVIDIICRDAVSGQISSLMYERFISEFSGNGYESEIRYVSGTDQIQSSVITIYDGTQVVALNRTVKDIDALRLLCLHTTQKSGDLSNIRLSGFMKWLGYNGSDNRNISFQLGENSWIRYSMKSWTGGFLPQYLEDEAAAQGKTDEYEKNYGAAVTDMLIQVDCPNLYSIQPQKTEELKYGAGTARRTVKDYSKPVYGASPGDLYPAYLRDRRPDDYYTAWVNKGYRYIEGVTCEGRYGNFLYAQAGWSLSYQNGAKALVRTSANPRQTGPIIGYQDREVDYHYDITYIHVKYVVNVTVSCRDISSLVDMAGLWEGLLPMDEAKYSGTLRRESAA